MSAEVEDLLAQATAILDGKEHIPAAQRTRAAAYLARQTLEQIVRRRCAALGADMRRASMRSQLIVLRILSPDCAEPAQAAWAGLSRACHRHAYELAPTEHEIRALIALVYSASD